MTTIQRFLEYYDITENVHLLLKMHDVDILTYVNYLITNETTNCFKKKYDNKTQFHIMHSLNNAYEIFDYKIEKTEVQNELKISKIINNSNVVAFSKTFASAINGSTNFNNYKQYEKSDYYKVLKISIICETHDTHASIIGLTSFKKMPFESFVANDNTFNSQFNVGQLLPLHKSMIFHNQYIAIEGNILGSNIDIFIYSILTLTMPIIISANGLEVNEVLSDLVAHGFDLNGIMIFNDNSQFIQFINNVQWNDYANKHLNVLANNKNALNAFISKEITRVKNSINDGFTFIQPSRGFKNAIDLFYKNDPNDFGFIVKILADIKLKNDVHRDDLTHVSEVIRFVYKIKNKKNTNKSTLHFQEACDYPATNLYHDIFAFADVKLKPTTNVNTTICCFCPCLEPADEMLSGVITCNCDIKMTHLVNSDLNLMSPGWMMSWFSNNNYSNFKNNKMFSVSYLFSLRGISEMTEHMKSDNFTYSVRQYIIDNLPKIHTPKVICMTNWNKDLPKKYPHVPLLPDSKECLYSSMFNISLENSKQVNYFSEKIIDCFLTFTIPLYIGCPNIGEYFDTRGIIFASNADDLMGKCNSLTPELYHSLHEHCTNNHFLVTFWTKTYKHTDIIKGYIEFMESYYD
jgi:hypothetical protein